jgi:hypothetical protein
MHCCSRVLDVTGDGITLEAAFIKDAHEGVDESVDMTTIAIAPMKGSSSVPQAGGGAHRHRVCVARQHDWTACSPLAWDRVVDQHLVVLDGRGGYVAQLQDVHFAGNGVARWLSSGSPYE